MKFKLKTFFLLAVASVLLVACSSESNKNGLLQIDIDEANKYFEDNKSGFVLLVTDNDEYFIPTVKRLAEDEEVNVAMYNPYQSDGTNDNEDSIWPNSKDIGGNTLYYMENNEVKGELKVNRYTDSQLTKEILNFFDLHK